MSDLQHGSFVGSFPYTDIVIVLLCLYGQYFYITVVVLHERIKNLQSN
jgi:hypothetical protein